MRKALAALLAAVALIACEPITPPDPNDTGTQLTVLFGDSLSFTSWDETTSLYVADADWQVSLNHDLGYRFDSPRWVARYPSVPAGSTVILALGTNDIASTLSTCWTDCQTAADIKADARHAIAAVTAAGAARVVVPTVNETSAGLSGGPERLWATVAWNDWLARADVSTHPDYRALDLADWATAAEGREDWLGPDLLHHNAAGETAYAQFLYDSRLP
jgi:hypothetical protein